MDYSKKSIEEHKKYRGKLSVEGVLPIENRDDLSIAYTPGVAAVCTEIADGSDAREFVTSKNTVAVITDGSAVLGLGNIGAVAGLPVMEGKAALFKKFGGVNAFPIALNTQDTEEIIQAVKYIAPTFGGINLEDIAAPRCFDIERRLSEELDIPVFHDDQHGAAIVALAGLFNALKVVGKEREDVKIVINGCGAAGVATAKLLKSAGFLNVYIADSRGLIANCRDDLNNTKHDLLDCCCVSDLCGALKDALVGADVFIGVSVGNLLTSDDIKMMNKDAIVFAMANPVPEILPDDARAGGARVVATGRSDYGNQLNNALVFPGLFKGLFESGAQKVTIEMKLKVAETLAELIETPTEDRIIPDVFDKRVAEAVSSAIIST